MFGGILVLLLARGALPASPDVFEDYFNDDVKAVHLSQRYVMKACLTPYRDFLTKLDAANTACTGGDPTFDWADLTRLNTGKDSDGNGLKSGLETAEACVYRKLGWTGERQVYAAVVKADFGGLERTILTQFESDVDTCGRWDGSFGARKKRSLEDWQVEGEEVTEEEEVVEDEEDGEEVEEDQGGEEYEDVEGGGDGDEEVGVGEAPEARGTLLVWARDLLADRRKRDNTLTRSKRQARQVAGNGGKGAAGRVAARQSDRQAGNGKNAGNGNGNGSGGGKSGGKGNVGGGKSSGGSVRGGNGGSAAAGRVAARQEARQGNGKGKGGSGQGGKGKGGNGNGKGKGGKEKGGNGNGKGKGNGGKEKGGNGNGKGKGNGGTRGGKAGKGKGSGGGTGGGKSASGNQLSSAAYNKLWCVDLAVEKALQACVKDKMTN